MDWIGLDWVVEAAFDVRRSAQFVGQIVVCSSFGRVMSCRVMSCQIVLGLLCWRRHLMAGGRGGGHFSGGKEGAKASSVRLSPLSKRMRYCEVDGLGVDRWQTAPMSDGGVRPARSSRGSDRSTSTGLDSNLIGFVVREMEFFFVTPLMTRLENAPRRVHTATAPGCSSIVKRELRRWDAHASARARGTKGTRTAQGFVFL